MNRDLMRRAIMESGPCIGAGAPAAEAAGIASSKIIMEKMKISSLKGMRSAKAAEIVAGTEGSNLTWSIDEWIMPADPGDLFQSGADGMGTIHADSVMLGSTINDGDLHKRAAEKGVPTTAAGLTTFLTKAGLTSAMATQALTTYKITSAATAPEVKAAYGKIRSDTCVTCPTKDLGAFLSSIKPAGTIDTFMYRFAGPSGNASMGAEVDSVFGKNVSKNGEFKVSAQAIQRRPL
jgi:carboxylesterase type B